MGRPAKFNRQAAIESAMNEIWRSGFEACSVKSISEKLGITRSSFYNAFESREALFLEALEWYFTRSPDRALAVIDFDAHILKVLTRVFKDVCRARASDPEARGCLVVNCVAELVAVDKTLGPVLEKAVLGSLDRLEHLLYQAAANGEIENKGDLREKALALQNLLIGLNVMAKVVRSEDDLWAAAKQTLKGLNLYEE
ncbi:hypothetical protein MNBD_GAMMA11-339 [hydrothermal vent metagenome]|uniref:HTH tetR-type domain-containing protein n=1 Tax=hydrothermal vent metagenome TaxID=652676 RepID=A0A3B0Y9J7_9ZZZZ